MDRIAADNYLWKPMFSEMRFPRGESIKQYVKSRSIRSINDLEKVVKIFFSNNPIGKLECHFFQNPETKVTVQITDNQSNLEVPEIMHCFCIGRSSKCIGKRDEMHSSVEDFISKGEVFTNYLKHSEQDFNFHFKIQEDIRNVLDHLFRSPRLPAVALAAPRCAIV